jgi:Helix-turn-helix domain
VRNFTRRFRAETGTTPLQWLLAQRVARAQELLETTHLPVEAVAHRCGFTDASTLRRHFARQTGTTLRAYRVAFSLRPSMQRASVPQVGRTRVARGSHIWPRSAHIRPKTVHAGSAERSLGISQPWAPQGESIDGDVNRPPKTHLWPGSKGGS